MPNLRSLPGQPTRRAVLLLLAAVGLTGCGPSEDIRTYTVPKPEAKVNPGGGDTAPDAAGGEYRILGAMFPADDPSWFFKITGKSAALGDHTAAFDQFLASVSFPKGPEEMPTWELPAGWKLGGRESIHAETILFGPADKPLKITVTPSKGGLMPNIDRWIKQVGGPGESAKYYRPVETKSGVKGVRVDVSGPTNPAGGMPPFMGKK